MSAITVGLDGSPESLAAADWAAREAAQRDVPLHLLHAEEPLRSAYPSFVGDPASVVIDAQRQWAADLLREAESRVARLHPGLRVTTGQVAEGAVLALLATTEEAGLLVLGSRGLGAVAGFLVGSVALAVVARTERPVVLVRAGGHAEDEHLPDATGTGATSTPYRDVVLGLDIEDPGDAVIEFAFEAARRRAAGLRVIHGWNPGLTDLLRPWKDKFPDVEVTAQAVVGGAGRHLVHASRDAALVVVGRKRRHAPVGSRIGPVTDAVLQHACAPVAVVPHA
ncbi:stress-inducible protein [Streptomyces sp. NRRL WC-3618]|uniref:universal stress protein n=1 Tax=Streptomyces sp. NRRL WC-3618 TaxID=1519490 RepID=UPI0006ADDE6A|nr:universal stress protein [Streptomyces sp. NRRL WC-3618]KOV62213.1 stress-inducible protein [Streptomyces sp. NRRL WC-3618]